MKRTRFLVIVLFLGYFQGNCQMTKLFLDTTAPFLTRFCNDLRSFNHFILQRPDAIECRLPMSYLDCCKAGDGLQIGSDCVTQFIMESQKAGRDGGKVRLPHKTKYMCGEKKMYNWLKRNELLNDPDLIWQPIQNNDDYEKSSPLHLAALKGDCAKAKECLVHGDDIDESDGEGRTALHIAIQNSSYELFQLLLSSGAHFGLSTGKGHTPLHEAALFDSEGQFLKILISAGAELNKKNDDNDTPLSCAMNVNNTNAIDILTQAGAKTSEQIYEALLKDYKERHQVL